MKQQLKSCSRAAVLANFDYVNNNLKIQKNSEKSEKKMYKNRNNYNKLIQLYNKQNSFIKNEKSIDK